MKRSIGNEKNVEKSKLINYTVKVKERERANIQKCMDAKPGVYG